MPKVRRSAISGKFVDKTTALSSPDSTYVDTVKAGHKKDLSERVWQFLAEKEIEPNSQIDGIKLPGLLLEFAESVLERN